MAYVTPTASRPLILDYGIPKDKKDLLSWSHVTDRMAKSLYYWICTVSPEGRPHSTPVDGLWIDDQLYFGGSPKTKRNRNLEENSFVCVHLESATDVVILQGEAHALRDPERSLAVRLSEESKAKYGYGPKPEEYASTSGVYVFKLQKVLAWKEFPKDATRWQY